MTENELYIVPSTRFTRTLYINSTRIACACKLGLPAARSGLTSRIIRVPIYGGQLPGYTSSLSNILKHYELWGIDTRVKPPFFLFIPFFFFACVWFVALVCTPRAHFAFGSSIANFLLFCFLCGVFPLLVRLTSILLVAFHHETWILISEK